MHVINVEGLPDSVVRSLEAMVANLKQHLVSHDEAISPEERMRRAAGSWAEDAAELDDYLAEVRRSRRMERPEPAP